MQGDLEVFVFTKKCNRSSKPSQHTRMDTPGLSRSRRDGEMPGALATPRITQNDAVGEEGNEEFDDVADTGTNEDGWVVKNISRTDSSVYDVFHVIRWSFDMYFVIVALKI